MILDNMKPLYPCPTCVLRTRVEGRSCFRCRRAQRQPVTVRPCRDCGESIEVSGQANRAYCVPCRNARYDARRPQNSSLVPDHAERMARYSLRAANHQPLFDCPRREETAR